jgi:hypothetical protein
MAVRLCNYLWRLLIGVVFLLAAYGKWREGINVIPPLSIYDRLVNGLLWRHQAILLIEVGIALWVLLGWRIRWSSAVAAALLIAFSIILTLELRSNAPGSCGCGIHEVLPGGDPRDAIKQAIARNALLLLGCAWLWFLGEEPEPPAAPANEPRPSDA